MFVESFRRLAWREQCLPRIGDGARGSQGGIALPRIFINYRRQDSEHAVGRLAEDLRRHFAQDQVFQDIHSIDPGADFIDALNRGLAECAAALVVIGPGWLSAANGKGCRRLDDPDDWVRQEIAETLGRKDVRVFPVLVGGAEMPAAEDLPEPLRPLARRQAFELTTRHWANDVDLLVEHLKRVPGLDLSASEANGRPERAKGPVPAAAAPSAEGAQARSPPPPTEPLVSLARTESYSPSEPASGRFGLPWKPLAILSIAGMIAIGVIVGQQTGQEQSPPESGALPPEKPAPKPGLPIVADTPGTVVSVPVTQGAAVKPGEVLIVIESRNGEKAWMRAPVAGVVATLPLQPGWPFDRGAVLVTLEPKPRDPAPRKVESASTPAAVGAAAQPSAAASRAPRAGEAFRDCDQCPEMVMVPAGSFVMGSPETERGRDKSEGPQHKVTIVRPFAVGKYEVTFAEWDACLAEGGCTHRPDDEGWGRGQRPVINVSQDDVQQYVAWLSKKTAKTYRLLSDAEWEYAARAGTTTAYPWGDDPGSNRANFLQSGSEWDGKRTAPVGSFEPNAFGLYDMIGNVYESVQDCWNRTYAGAPSDGSAWRSGDCGKSILRGGAWYAWPSQARVANHLQGDKPGLRTSFTGFRVARTL